MGKLRRRGIANRGPDKRAARLTGLASILLLTAACDRNGSTPMPREDKMNGTAAAPVTPFTATATTLEPGAGPTPFVRTTEQTFHIQATTPQSVPAEPAAVAERRPEKLRDQMARCLDFGVTRDASVSVTTGQQVRVVARNKCDVSFSPTDTWIEVRAISLTGSGTAGRQVGQFQTTIEPRGGAETILVVPCNPDRLHRFEASVWSGAGGERNAGE